MSYLATTGTAGVIEINGTVIVEILTFLVMLAILARYVYPRIVDVAEARQRAITEQLREAERTRAEAEGDRKDAQAQLDEARRTAQGVLDNAGKSAEQLRQEVRQKAEDESRRIVESARKEIEVEREQAVRSVRNQVAGLVVAATEKVIGETLDERKHRQLIEQAIEEVSSGDGRR
jgi:F-type H+-transporting ATPase subunit b